ncbi:methionyl-tRNA formyltransferase [Peptostreptococcus russellii]|uniref:Methionyl-tRNA formyltransferase n=1 Tax=Peptostreptococcus russellii TaxID=215200 RepID=A0A1H8FI68_9FIRM|nr:methionyl-tRNA formyltransferase [Peptostreptococcus russellii]MBC2577203.1 methionyl-tRNA formyltransferase [Peptostreptococcus russellii]SEN31433.1 methionyl-tRNA formyltransferase [Peptostreptococcus russellii]
MRIVFMGTPEISVGTLKRIIADGHELLAVVTQPDRPRGRGKKMMMSPVKEVALENNIEVLQPQKASDPEFIEKLKELNPELIVVVAYGQILRKNLLEIPKKGCVNVHVSLLPKLRGAAPINWTIINGDSKTGVTTMFMDEGLDTGDIIMSKEFKLDDEITAGELHDWMMVEGAELLSQTVKAIESGNYTRTKQDDEESTYAPMMDKNLGHIDFSKSAQEIHNLVRGTIPWPGAWCESDYGKIKIWKTKVIKREHSQENGKVLKVDKEGIEVACGKDILLIVDIQMPNKKRMPVSEFIKGNSIEEGTILR